MYKKISIHCMIMAIFLGASAFAEKAEVLCDMPPGVQEMPTVAAPEPNVPPEIAAEGFITVDLTSPVLLAMAPATEPPTFSYRLNYRAKELIDGESWKLYQQFFVSDPNHPEKEPDADFLRQQLALPLDKMDTQKLSAHLEQCGPKLALLEQAVRCRTIVWPKIQIVTQSPPTRRNPFPSYSYDPSAESGRPILEIKDMPMLVKQLDEAGLLLTAKARCHLARGEYDAANQWLRAALAQGRQMTVDADGFLAMAGAVNAGRVLAQLETWVQQPQSPSLFRSLGDLPRPLILFSNIREQGRYSEEMGRSSDILEVQPQFLTQSPQIIQNIERIIAALQCVEAVRLYAAVNDGYLPESLADITDVRVPLDPVTRQLFLYSRKEQTLTAQQDPNTPEEYQFRYRIIHKPQPDIPNESEMMGGPGPMMPMSF